MSDLRRFRLTRRLGALLLGAIAVTAASGCGTLMGSHAILPGTTPVKPGPYVGVRHDARTLRPQALRASKAPDIALALLDMPLSFALDTALLPITVTAVIPEEARERPRPRPIEPRPADRTRGDGPPDSSDSPPRRVGRGW